MERKGFTLVEIMFVVLIIAVLAALAAPNIIRSRRKTRTGICLNNLRVIDTAINQWVLEDNIEEGDNIIEASIAVYLKGGTLPTCPSGNENYLLYTVDADPQVRCQNEIDGTRPDHKLP